MQSKQVMNPETQPLLEPGKARREVVESGTRNPADPLPGPTRSASQHAVPGGSPDLFATREMRNDSGKELGEFDHAFVDVVRSKKSYRHVGAEPFPPSNRCSCGDSILCHERFGGEIQSAPNRVIWVRRTRCDWARCRENGRAALVSGRAGPRNVRRSHGRRGATFPVGDPRRRGRHRYEGLESPQTPTSSRVGVPSRC